MNLIDIEIEKVGKEEKIDWQYQKGPCKVCGTTNYPLSCGGPDVCPACDCYAPCPRCKILIKENELLRSSLQRVISETKKKCIEALPKTRSCLDCSSQYECGCDSFNQAIQQSKQNIEEVR